MADLEVIKRAPNKILSTRTTDDDKLIAYLRGKLDRTDLSPKLQEKVDMMHQAYDLIRKHQSRVAVIPMMMALIKTNGSPISQSTAYRLFEECQRLFGESSILNQQFWVDVEMGAIEEDIKLAREMKDLKALASLRKIKQEYILKAMGSGDALFYERIQPPQIEVNFFPRSMEVKLPKDKELSKLVSEKLKQIAEDVEFTEQ